MAGIAGTSLVAGFNLYEQHETPLLFTDTWIMLEVTVMQLDHLPWQI